MKNILSLFTAQKSAGGGNSSPYREAMLSESALNYSVSPQVAMKAATVYACVKIISEDVGKLPVHLYKDENGAKLPVDNDNIAYILRKKPNHYMTPFEFYEGIVWDLLIHGNFIAQISRSSRGEVLEILPLDPRSIQITKNAKTGLFEYSATKLNGENKVFKRDEILHIRDGVDSDGKGRSRIKQAADAIGLEVEAEGVLARLFKNGLRLSSVVSHPASLSDKARERLRDYITKKMSGPRQGEPLILEEGVEWKPSQMTTRDAQLLELREFQRGVILSIFRLPPHKIGVMSGATHSNMEIGERAYWVDTVLSHAIRIEQAIYKDVFTDTQRKLGYYLKFNIDSMVRADMITRYQAYQIGRRAGILSADDCRAKEDMNPRPDGLGGVYMESGDLYPSGEKENEI
jgi:HK97 family phage portal protein